MGDSFASKFLQVTNYLDLDKGSNYMYGAEAKKI